MDLRVLQFSAGAAGENPLQSELQLESLHTLTKTKPQHLPMAYVVRAQDLGNLREFKDAVIDRGRKHKAKALSELLLGYEKIPLIDGNYTNVGQLRRSIRVLLANALQKEDRNLYLIGTEEALFSELWSRVEALRR